MGRVNFNSNLMKRLDLQLDKAFPSLSACAFKSNLVCDIFADSDFDDESEILNKVLFSIQPITDDNISLELPVEIACQRISPVLFGKSLRTYLDRYRNSNRPVYTDDICAEVNIQRTHLYKILRGERRPSRDLAIAFSFTFKMTVKECQDLILLLGEQLNEHVKRDYILLFGLKHRRTLDSINEILEYYEECPLIDLQ
jgi:hypothetical protein